MKPFELSSVAAKLSQTYISADTFRALAPEFKDRDVFGVVQQWMTEGIPYAFKDTPLLYEDIRTWLGIRLGVHGKELTLIGSGRLGYSFKAPPVFGRPFDESSDLDFTVASTLLFNQCKDSFEQWKRDFSLGRVKPKNPKEHRLWPKTLEHLPKNIARGFIDPHHIPNRYEPPKDISNTLFLLREKINATSSFTNVQKVSIRIYADWRAFTKQMQLNLSSRLLDIEESTPQLEG